LVANPVFDTVRDKPYAYRPDAPDGQSHVRGRVDL
jgi:hypothetical protein